MTDVVPAVTASLPTIKAHKLSVIDTYQEVVACFQLLAALVFPDVTATALTRLSKQQENL